MQFKLTSSAFADGKPIPGKYTCDGVDTAPPLAWVGTPPGTKSLALIVDDPDAPDPRAPRMTWVHWVLYNIPSSVTELDAGSRGGKLPPGTKQGLNDWKATGYRGPCPPIGRHRYFHKLYALDVELLDLGAANKAAVEKAMAGHILAEAQLMGTYQR
jgi:Raf kinase inhibitor-like YbhB/YbcL family protein